MLASRADPPLPLAPPRARGQLAELRAAEAAFHHREAAASAPGRAAGAYLPHPVVAVLADRTEGMGRLGCSEPPPRCAGRPMSPSFRCAPPPAPTATRAGLPAEEVLERQQPAGTRRPRRWRPRCWSVPRLAARCGHRPAPAARRCWSRWSGQGWFWCRRRGGVARWQATTTCSPTCCAPACSRCPAGAGAQLHRNAPAWYQEHGLADDAIGHAVAAGEMTRAARLIEQHFFRMRA